jgi:hypothetical protein
MKGGGGGTWSRMEPRTNWPVQCTYARLPNRAFTTTGWRGWGAMVCAGMYTGMGGPPTMPHQGLPVRRDCLQMTHMQLSL